jgi:glycosyltransferase involved in cell wall biosynthesis
MRIALVLAGSYPPGTAAARRVQAFAAGLQRIGVESIVIAVAGAHQEHEDAMQGRDSAGVTYVLAKAPQAKPSRWRRFFERPTLLRNAVERELGNSATDAVLVYGHWWFLNQAVHRWCRSHGIPLLADCTEWWTLQPEAAAAYFDTLLFRRLLFPKLTGVVAISRVWEEHAQRSGLPVIRVPSVQLKPDASAGPTPPTPSGAFVVTYVGALYRRDLPFGMIEGVRQAVANGVDMRLVVIGQTDLYPSARRCQAYCRSVPELVDRVVFTGRISDEELQRRMNDTHALLLLRDDEWASKACFPTRLPEFLITGRPVITSSAGDVPSYLRHMQDAWLLPPGNHPGALAKAFAILAADPALADQIGTAGRVTALSAFSAEQHMQRLATFVEQLAMRPH